MAHDIALLPGDGIGPEVIAEAVRVLEAASPGGFTWTRYPFGGAHWKATGETLPESAIAELGAHEAVLLGALGAPDIPMGLLEREVLLRLRFTLDLYVNLRPARRLPDCDLVVVRENTEGLYTGVGGALRAGTEYEEATEVSLNTYRGVRRLVEFGFGLAETRARRHVTLVHKANVLRYAGALWRRVTDEVAVAHPDVAVAYGHADAVCALVVTEPRRYDVIVTDNLFGDIVSDVTAVVAGGLGVAASGTFNPETGAGVFEPVHGSAPDIAGRGIASPIAAIRSAALLCGHIGEHGVAARVDAALDAVGVPAPGVPTREITEAVLTKLQ